MQTFFTISTLILLLASMLVVNQARREAGKERESARAESEAIRADARAEAADLAKREARIEEREKELAEDQRGAQAYARSLDDRVLELSTLERSLETAREELERQHLAALAEAGQLTVDEARKELTERLTAGAEAAVALEAHRRLKRAKESAELQARQVLVEAMQRQAVAATAQASVTRIELPSDEMKGRIIGREGRNIRAFEALTGVNVIVDEGVNAVLLSSFDPERREIAAVTLQALIDDGRIQPQRVESAHAKAVAGAPDRARSAALDAVDAAGVSAVAESLVGPLGALRLRTSFGQNVLSHLVECSQIAASIAEQIGADVELARRSAFLHDIGKSLTGQREGTHAALGAQLAKEAGEQELVVRAIAAHHDEEEHQSLESVIVQIADAISASRPGARREDTDAYVDRMEGLEKLVASHAGVAQVFAMAAGRELRVVVEPSAIDDSGIESLARTIAEHIEKDFSFAGEIKVTVIRETRADSVAGQG